MMMASAGPDDLEALLEELPPELREEVAAFARSLLERQHQRHGEEGEGMGFSWAGALSHLGDDYTSVELQEEARDLWGT